MNLASEISLFVNEMAKDLIFNSYPATNALKGHSYNADNLFCPRCNVSCFVSFNSELTCDEWIIKGIIE